MRAHALSGVVPRLGREVVLEGAAVGAPQASHHRPDLSLARRIRVHALGAEGAHTAQRDAAIGLLYSTDHSSLPPDTLQNLAPDAKNQLKMSNQKVGTW